MATTTIVGLYGTLGVPDTLASNTATIYQIGEDLVWQNMQLLLDAHNRILKDEMEYLVGDAITMQQMRYGGTTTMDMEEMDEHGQAGAQKWVTGQIIGFPLRKYGRSLQWTRSYFLQATGEEFLENVQGMIDGDRQNVIRQVKLALFNPVNYNFVDSLVRSVQAYPLAIKRLANADGSYLPPGPNGEYFNPSTHNHYLGATSGGTFSDADLTSTLNTVLEHYSEGQAVILINSAQESTIRGFTPNFQAAVDVELHQAVTNTYDPRPLDMVAIYNRYIGRYRGANVWVKPWIPAGYAVVIMTGQIKVLRWRRHETMPDELSLMSEEERYPLRARSFERNFGVSCYNRVGAAILDSNHTNYTAPTI